MTSFIARVASQSSGTGISAVAGRAGGVSDPSGKSQMWAGAVTRPRVSRCGASLAKIDRRPDAVRRDGRALEMGEDAQHGFDCLEDVRLGAAE